MRKKLLRLKISAVYRSNSCFVDIVIQMESGDRQAGRQHIDGQKVGRQASERKERLMID